VCWEEVEVGVWDKVGGCGDGSWWSRGQGVGGSFMYLVPSHLDSYTNAADY
jgi:hypothetical protein